MRRVQSSLGMRRSSSFFWTPAAHHEFERALSTLNARGAEVSAASIMTLMGLHSDLKMNDIERHLKVPTHPGAPRHPSPRQPQLPTASPTTAAPAAPANPHSCSELPCASCTRLAAATITYTTRLLPSQKKLLVQRRVLAQLNTQTTSPLDCSTGSSSQPTSPPRPSMAAVAEEPGPVEGTPAAAVIATLTDQLDRQVHEHRQMAAMREHMLASTEGGAAVAT